MHGKTSEEHDVSDAYPANRTEETPSPLRQSQRGGRHRLADRVPISPPPRTGLSSTPVRVTLLAAVIGGLAFVATSESRSAATDRTDALDSALAQRAVAADEQRASRFQREPIEATPTATPTATPSVTVTPSPSPTKPRPKKPAKPSRPKPVGGLLQAQMDNANAIVKVGRKMQVPRRGIVVAIATALQESNLYNLANDFVPESLDYPHQGSGFDNDSVGLFQQRSTSGWGTVEELMQPAYAAQAFFSALLQVPGWQEMSVTQAAQTVQVSAFPDAYAQHEDLATTVVDALFV